MKARISGPTRVLGVSLLCFGVLVLLTAAAATASAQTRSIPSFIYGIDSDGALKVYRHNGVATGAGLETAGAWEGPNNIGSGWNDYKTVFAGGAGIIYGIKADGTLEWRQHQGLRGGSNQWGETRIVGRGWGDFAQVFPGGDGIIYAITHEGKLRWYKHNAYLTGAGLETPGAWADTKEVGRGWGFKQVFSSGGGIIYAITQAGELLWYKHNGYLTGAGLETPGAWEGKKMVGRGWGFKQVFSSGGGIIYAITQAGELLWYKHNGYLTGAGLETPGAWEGKKMVGRGWGDFDQVFALLQGSSLIDAERRRRTSDSVGATTGTTDGPGERATPRESNEIRCRGYSRTGGAEFVFFAINSRPSGTGETIVTFEMAFSPGTRAAGARGEGLQPGDCAWADRPIGYPAGPFRIRFETVANAQLKQALKGSPIDRSSTAAESYPDVNTIPIYLKGENHYWSFGGIINRGSYFVATGHGYWKPAIAVGDVKRSPTEPARPKGVLYPTKP